MKKYWVFGAVLLATVAADQGTKVWARHSLRPIYPRERTVIDGFWNFRYSENPGSAFGLFRDLPYARSLLTVVGLGALVFIVGVYLRKPEANAPVVSSCLALIAGGAIGNLIDRVSFGRVTDFIVWHYRQHEWPAFNVADAALVAGLAALFLFPPRARKQSDGSAGQPATKSGAKRARAG